MSIGQDIADQVKRDAATAERQDRESRLQESRRIFQAILARPARHPTSKESADLHRLAEGGTFQLDDVDALLNGAAGVATMGQRILGDFDRLEELARQVKQDEKDSKGLYEKIEALQLKAKGIENRHAALAERRRTLGASLGAYQQAVIANSAACSADPAVVERAKSVMPGVLVI